jgi:predicted O-methyltransferase YrrM
MAPVGFSKLQPVFSSPMNPVLQQLVETGCTETASGEWLPMHSQIPPLEGEFLQAILSDLKPKATLEIGLAYGVSSLYILDALSKQEGCTHIVVDPCQFDPNLWNGCGLRNIEKAGFRAMVDFHHAPSHEALPEILKTGQRIDFAFIDGWHTFDYSFIDFFYAHKMLNVGGVIALDDANVPSVRKLARYILANHAYSVYECLETYNQPVVKRRRVLFNNSVLPLLKSLDAKLNILKPDALKTDAELGLFGRCIVLKKEAEDAMENPSAYVPF